MKRIIASGAVVALMSLAAIGATRAFFVDTEVSEGNTIAAGQIDLILTEDASMPFAVEGIAPGDTGEGFFTISSAVENLDSELDVAFTNYFDYENSCIEPEISAGDPCGNGDLGLGLTMAMFVDVNQDGVYNQADGDIELEYSGNTNTTPGLQFAKTQSFVGDSWDDVLTMVGGDVVDIVVMWNLPSTWSYPKAQTIMMTDSIEFDIEVSLEQVGGSGGVAL